MAMRLLLRHGTSRDLHGLPATAAFNRQPPRVRDAMASNWQEDTHGI